LRAGVVLAVVSVVGLSACLPPSPPAAAPSGDVPHVDSANITFDAGNGTGAPPSVLGGCAVTAFGPDSSATLGTAVPTVTGPDGTVAFAPALTHFRVGSGWSTWSNGYAGDVYSASDQSVTLTMPGGVRAFYLYAEPVDFSVFDVTATAQDGTTSGPVSVNGNGGATFFGFFASGAATIASIVVTTTDAQGFAIGEFGTGTCESNSPPVCTQLTASPDLLWPPDHRLVTVTISGATDPDGDPLTYTVTGVTQDEPVNSLGDGDTAPDAVLLTGDQLQLRAERSGTGDGRVYRIAVTVSDGRGADCTGVATVAVPHDQNPNTNPIDSGTIYNSL
jgi:hypothetical protein